MPPVAVSILTVWLVPDAADVTPAGLLVRTMVRVWPGAQVAYGEFSDGELQDPVGVALIAPATFPSKKMELTVTEPEPTSLTVAVRLVPWM